jgi:N-dimethylarginine dimethylaminohydrolase
LRDLTSWGDAVVQQNIVRRQALEAALQAPTRAEEKREVQAVINNLKRDEG